jgi:pilus assembly protein CpaB
MRPKSLLLLALALGCGLVAAVGINQILATPSDHKPTVSIVVAKREIKKGDMIKPDDIRLQDWQVESLPDGAVQNVSDLAERRVKTLVVPGEAILESKLVAKNSTRESEIPPGMKGVPVKVDNVSGGAGLIFPGDNVDVLLHVEANAARGIPQTMTKVLFKNIKVHAVDDVLERPAPGEPSIPAKTITLLVTPAQATKITFATEVGTIRLVMRSEKDAEDDTLADTVSVSDLLGDSSGGDSISSSLSHGGPSLHLTPLPPVDTGTDANTGSGLGDAMSQGMKGLGDFLDKMNTARELGTTEQEEKPWRMIVIEGGETREMEFAKGSRLARSTGGEPSSSAKEPVLPDFTPSQTLAEKPAN